MRLGALGSRLTLDRHARLFWPSMFMAHEPQMPSLRGGGGDGRRGEVTGCEGSDVNDHGTWSADALFWGMVVVGEWALGSRFTLDRQARLF
jgi:hypothetical protein